MRYLRSDGCGRRSISEPKTSVGLEWPRGQHMTVKAICENGVFKPQEPAVFAERTEVVIAATTPTDADHPTRWKAAEALIGLIHDAPPTWLKDTTNG